MAPEYNRKVRKIAFVAVLSLLAACTKDIQNKDAVKGSILDYLKARQSQTGLNMDLMQVELTSLVFTAGGKEADVDVMFTPKAGGAGMHIPYKLDRNGDKWVVRARAEGEANPHGANGENPHGPAGMPQMPLNHPPIGKQP